MSLIEQAAQRLEELRRAGVRVSEAGQPAPAPPSPVRLAPAPTHAAEPTRSIHLDLARLAARGFITPDAGRTQIADEFRMIKRPIIANALAEGDLRINDGNLVMVTSSVPGEGKSFSAINLAMSIAMEVNRTVLLIDADVARPSLSRTLGIPDSPGLLDVLVDKSVRLNELLMRTNVENLTFLSSGRRHPRAAEMLASDAMAELMDELKNRYTDGIVLFDSPPLLVTTEAPILASRMGQIVFVVDAERTLQNEVKRALATIEACPIRMMVLNKARTTAQGAYAYGYGY